MTVYTSPHYKPPAVIVLCCSIVTTILVVVLTVRQSLAIRTIEANAIKLDAAIEQIRNNTNRLNILEAK